MNTKTMFEREDFFPVLFDSIRKYFFEVHNLDITITKNKQPDSTKFYLYYIPLFASAFPMSNGMKEFLYSEYNIRGSLIKYLAGKIGVFAITHSFGIGAYSSFYVNSNQDIVKNIFISPCNRTIRFYNFVENYVDCIAKAGYGIDFLRNQLMARKKYQYDFVPKVLDSGESWYRESIMHGNALARVRDMEKYQSCLEIAVSDIQFMAKDTLEYKDSLRYYIQLKEEVRKAVEQLGIAENNGYFDLIEGFFSRHDPVFENNHFNIPLCLSHGDVQEGNIWVHVDGSVTIYDWETAKFRSVWYDPVTLFYRMHGGMEYTQLLGLMKEDTRYLLCDPCKSYSDDKKQMIAVILVIEDFIFNISEALQLQGNYPRKRANEVFDKFQGIMKRGVQL